MGESGEKAAARSRLADAVLDVKNRAADREDIAVELREAVRARLELLAAELAPTFAEVPKEIEFFDFAISSGLEPRLWIDAVAHVGMARDRRTFVFVRDTRVGRVTMAENTAIPPVADAVTNYIAERIVERERALASFSRPGGTTGASGGETGAAAPEPTTFRSVLVILLLGALFGLGLAAAVFWDRLSPLLLP